MFGVTLIALFVVAAFAGAGYGASSERERADKLQHDLDGLRSAYTTMLDHCHPAAQATTAPNAETRKD